ncbi:MULTISPECIES: stage V sporulation protein SpoVM [unclassified Lysinibacillus]
MKVYTFQLPKFLSNMTRACIRLFRREKK